MFSWYFPRAFQMSLPRTLLRTTLRRKISLSHAGFSRSRNPYLGECNLPLKHFTLSLPEEAKERKNRTKISNFIFVKWGKPIAHWFDLNSHTVGFCRLTQKLEPPLITSSFHRPSEREAIERQTIIYNQELLWLLL